MTTLPRTRSLPWPAPAVPQDPALQALIARCLKGDDSAYATLYDAYAAYAYRLAYGLLQHREDAEEVLQDSFAYAFRRLDHFDPRRSQFKSWLYRIVVSRCRNKRRRRWLPTLSLTPLLGDTLPDDDNPAPDHVAALNERQQRVWQALGRLSPKLRETAMLRYYEGLTYPEIGNILGIPPKTAESRMRLAHKALRKLLDGEEWL